MTRSSGRAQPSTMALVGLGRHAHRALGASAFVDLPRPRSPGANAPLLATGPRRGSTYLRDRPPPDGEPGTTPPPQRDSSAVNGEQGLGAPASRRRRWRNPCPCRGAGSTLLDQGDTSIGAAHWRAQPGVGAFAGHGVLPGRAAPAEQRGGRELRAAPGRWGVASGRRPPRQQRSRRDHVHPDGEDEVSPGGRLAGGAQRGAAMTTPDRRACR